MEEMDIASVKERSIKGIKALTSRTFILQLVGLLGMFLLSIFLSPSIFGVYYVVQSAINFLTYFSDIGLAAALIQKKENLTDADLSTTFTIQQILILSIVVLSLIFSGIVADFYKLDKSGLWLFRALVVSFLLSSLKTIPSVLLERKLDFQILIIPQIVEQIAFYLVAVIMASRGMGIISFTYGVLVRSVLGLITIYLLRPWRPTFGINRIVAKRLLKFGIPFQLNSFLALMKDDLLTLFLGKIIPFTQIGYIGWAKKYAEVPLRLIMDSVTRVMFPAFSRIQHSEDSLRKGIEKTLFGMAVTLFPVYIVMTFIIQPFVYFIPKYTKWEPAIFAFFLYCISSAIAGLTSPLTNILNAVGKIKITLILMIMWLVLTWFLTLLCINLIGFNGVPLAALLVSFSIVAVIFLVKKVLSFSFIKSIINPFLAAMVMFIWYSIFRLHSPFNIWAVTAIGLTGVILYMTCLLMLDRQRLRDLIFSFVK
jgi:O-antigen/teichoic acid export membrane protein